ncbi:SDR family NAD(P)-dependent oxidoreductase [Nonomuraea phyllanthi]|nr:SDR family NAD(P)-dependent oxidoreductase [Nonomuraea phyllanthi]
MKTELRGRTVLITGGTSGIGRALAEELDRRGNTVIVCGQRTDRLAELRERHPGIAVHQCDLALDDHRQRLADQLAKEFPSLDMVVNNAGIQLRSDVSRPIDPARLRAETDVNLIAPTHLTSLLAGQLAGSRVPPSSTSPRHWRSRRWSRWLTTAPPRPPYTP